MRVRVCVCVVRVVCGMLCVVCGVVVVLCVVCGVFAVRVVMLVRGLLL